MKKYIVAVLLLIPNISFADSKISAMTETTSPSKDDNVPLVINVSTSPANRRSSIANVFKAGDITIDGTNIGMGSTAPGTKLDVQGTVRALGFSGDGSLMTNVIGIYSPTAWVDCVQTAGSNGSICSGSNATTTGSINSGQYTLTVASASGWSVGMGIAIQNAGSGGTSELITYVTAISGTTFTLNDAAAATASSKNVYHDDTRALQAALDSAKNVKIRAGNYNITSGLTLTVSKWVLGDGEVGRDLTSSGSALTVLLQRSNTINHLTVSAGYVTLSNFSIQIASGFTATAGYAITLNGSGVIGDRQKNINYVLINGTYGGIKIDSTNGSNDRYDHIWINSRVGTAAGLYVNLPTPYGGVQFDKITIKPWLTDGNTGGTGIYITAADTNTWTQVYSIGWNNNLKIDNSNGLSKHQKFIGCSFENAANSNPAVILSSTVSGQVEDISFIGSEFGVSTTGISIGANVNNVTLIGNQFQALTNGINISAITGDVQYYGNLFTSVTNEIVGLSVKPNNFFKSSTLAQSSYVAVNSASNSSTSGAFAGMYQDDGTTPVLGTRLGAWVAGGARDTSHTMASSGGMIYYSDGIWSNTSVPTSARVELAPSGSTSRSSVQTWKSDGNVGIGTTLPVGLLDVNRKLVVLSGGNIGVGSITPGTKLDVQGTVRAIAFSGDGSGLSGVGGTPGGSSGEIQYNNAGALGGGTNVIIDSNNNVGIGTVSPKNKLGVSGSAAIGSTYAGINSAPSDSLIVSGAMGVGTFAPTTQNSQYYLNMYKDVSTGAFISVSNINTGTQPSTGYQLTTKNTEGYLRLYPTDWSVAPTWAGRLSLMADTGSSGLQLGTTSGATSNIIFMNSTTPRMIINGANVGIGTTSPLNKLGVSGNAAIGESYAGITSAPSNGLLVEGNVGIGSTAPGAALDVQGSVRFNQPGTGRPYCGITATGRLGVCVSAVGSDGTCTCN